MRDYPMIEVGVFELNRNPKNYFAEIEQSAFEPRNVVPGMGFSPDRMLQGRLISYPGCAPLPAGSELRVAAGEPAEVPVCDLSSRWVDGAIRTMAAIRRTMSRTALADRRTIARYKERPTTYASATVERYDHRELDGDYYTQPGNLFRLLTAGGAGAAGRQYRRQSGPGREADSGLADQSLLQVRSEVWRRRCQGDRTQD